MPSTHTIRARFAPIAALMAAITAAAALAATAGGASAAVGQPPPGWAANAGAWPAHNYDLANTRATTQTPINSQTVSRLKVKWTFAFKGASGFGAFASVANDVVFTSAYAGTLYAFDTQTGKTLWTVKTPAGINSFPAVDGDTLLVGAAATGFTKKPKFQLIAYSLA